MASAGPVASNSPKAAIRQTATTDYKFSASEAWHYLLKQCDFGPRKPGTSPHMQCRDFLAEEMKQSCDNVRLQPFEHVWSQTGQTVRMWNVIGEQNWDDAKVRVALFAHWDTRPTADQETDPQLQAMPIPGANDGASGVAVLLELMRALKGRHPGIGIQFVMVDGEDLGPGLDEMFLGAEKYAKNLPTPRPQYGILLDMIGDKDLSIPEDPLSIHYAPGLVKALYLEASRAGLRNTFPPYRGPDIEDDHVPLNQAGLPTVDFIDFTYAPWHTLRDTPDKCSPESLGKVGHLLEAWFLDHPTFEIK